MEYKLVGPMTGFTTLSGSTGSETPKALRKRAKAVEKEQRATEKRAKAYAKAERQRNAEMVQARAALVAVAADESKGYSRVWAARTILGLEGGE